jgi:DNA topoisomerase-6 subunit B
MNEQDKIFEQFKQHSVAEFFKKNRQMLGFSGKVRSLTTIIHEYVTNSLDACEEAGILPDIKVKIEELAEKEHYRVTVEDNGPGIPKSHVGRALGQMLSGTKFHRYLQQRGQQGIGASGCTMYSLLTTGKAIKALTGFSGKIVECNISVDFQTNAPVITEVKEYDGEFRGLKVEAEFKEVKYEKSNYGVYEYLRRTALANPHASISLIEPTGETAQFPRSVDAIPRKPMEIKPHPLGIGPHDLLDFAKRKTEHRRISSFLQDSFSRFSAGKVNELKELVPDIDLNKKPEEMTWEEAEKIVNAFKQMKWIAPALDAIVPIGKEQIEKSFTNIFTPEVLMVTERSPKVYRGGIPFMVEAALAYGGGVAAAGKKGEIMRFANRVPLPFDSSGCAITEAVKNIDWKRYDIKNFEEEPVVVLINLVSVYVPYTSAGKQAISSEEDIIDEIKNAVMEAARGVQRYLSGKRKVHELENKRKVVTRYVEQLSNDVSDLAGEKNKEKVKKELMKIIEEKYLNSNDELEAKEELKNAGGEDAPVEEEEENESEAPKPKKGKQKKLNEEEG